MLFDIYDVFVFMVSDQVGVVSDRPVQVGVEVHGADEDELNVGRLYTRDL